MTRKAMTISAPMRRLLSTRMELAMKGIVIGIMMLFFAPRAFSQSAQSDSLFSIGVDLYEAGKYFEAMPYFERAAALDEMEIAPESHRYGYCVDWLASCYYKSGFKYRAQELSPYNYALPPVDRRLTAESDAEADLSEEAPNIDEAIRHAERCLAIETANLGKVSAFCAGSYLTIGNLYFHKGDLDKALMHYNEGISVLQQIGLEKHMLTFQLLLGKIHVNLYYNDIAGALSEIKSLESIAEFEKLENGNEYPTAIVEILHARIGLQNQDYANAADNAVKAFRGILKLYTPSDTEKLESLSDCISILNMLTRYDEVISLTNEALAKMPDDILLQGIMLSYLGECTCDIATFERSLYYLSQSGHVDSYNSTKSLLASIHEHNGDVRKAIEIYEEIADYYAHTDQKNSTYIRVLRSLGDLYEKTGDFSRAYSYYDTVLSLLSEDKESPDFILTYLRWVPIYLKAAQMSGTDLDWTKGYEIGKELNDLFSKIVISDFLNLGIGITTIANVMLPFFHIITQNINLTQAAFLSSIENILTPLTYDYLIPLCSADADITHQSKSLLAHIKYIEGQPDKAIDLIKEIVSSCRSQGWECNNYLHDLAYYQYNNGDTQEAYDNFSVGFSFNKDLIISGYRWMTADERLHLTEANRGNIDILPRFAALTPNDRRYAALGYNVLLFSKGLLLNSTIELSRLIQEEGDADALQLWDKWRELNQKSQALEALGDEGRANELKAEARDIEIQLIDSSKSFGDYTSGLTVDYTEVQAALSADDIAIEFFSYQKDAKSRLYGALVLQKSEAPRYVAMGADSEWGELSEKCYSDDRLFNKLFQELKCYFPPKDKGCIYFSPEGILHSIAIENLPGAQSYNFKRLSSTRELALRGNASARIDEMAIFGGVKYGVGELSEYYDDAEPGNREISDLLAYLPGTKYEAEKIYELFSERMKVTKLLDEKASESNFKNLSGKRTALLHIATHGFFEPANVPGIMLTNEADVMKTSGLFLAGAQNSLWGMADDTANDDGILSAYEISMLDLRGLKLAVLSACDTGRGLLNADGVFGLQRGFKQAGAEGLMMSLWKVDDTATQMLMELFYSNLSAGKEPYSALRDAQNRVKAAYPDPQYWASFILVDAISNLNL